MWCLVNYKNPFHDFDTKRFIFVTTQLEMLRLRHERQEDVSTSTRPSMVDAKIVAHVLGGKKRVHYLTWVNSYRVGA